MLNVPVNSVGEFGVIADRKPHELPLNAWSDAKNVRFRDGFAEKFLGEKAFTTPSSAPYFLLPVPTNTTYFWVIAGLLKVYCFTGSTHTDITRTVGGDYGATVEFNWTGGMLNGVPVINNAVDAPQMWSPPTAATALAPLTAWPASTTCRVMQAFRNFLVAGDVTKSGTRYRNMVKWSSQASPGAVPASWDETNPAYDAGEWTLADTGGSVIDFAQLRDTNIVYKDDSVYQMQYIGGDFIFRFTAIAKTIGILSRRCVVEYQQGLHVFFGRGDIVRHDGQQAASILDGRMRRWLENNLDLTNYWQSFAVHYSQRAEVWFCFPAGGNTFATLALVWNYQANTITVRELDNWAHAQEGVLGGTATNTWDSDSNAWDTDNTIWNDYEYHPIFRNILAAVPGSTALRAVDYTNQIVGVSSTAYLERTGIGVPLSSKSPPDFKTMKFFSEVWPRFEGTDGGVVNVTVGTQDSIDGAVTWQPPVVYVIGTTEKIDADISGRLLALRFESNTDVDWRLHGYELVVTPDGVA